ncbi:unnamed protein product [Moneuplotes crassus]|nr:unnamed protein product [Moneuplotes crassus]
MAGLQHSSGMMSPEDYRMMMHEKLVTLIREEKDLLELKKIIEDRIEAKKNTKTYQIKVDEVPRLGKEIVEESSIAHSNELLDLNKFDENKSDKASTNNFKVIKTYMRQSTIQSVSRWSRFAIVSHKSAAMSEEEEWNGDEDEEDEARLEVLDNIMSKLSKGKKSIDQSVSHKMENDSINFG